MQHPPPAGPGRTSRRTGGTAAACTPAPTQCTAACPRCTLNGAASAVALGGLPGGLSAQPPRVLAEQLAAQASGGVAGCCRGRACLPPPPRLCACCIVPRKHLQTHCAPTLSCTVSPGSPLQGRDPGQRQLGYVVVTRPLRQGRLRLALEEVLSMQLSSSTAGGTNADGTAGGTAAVGGSGAHASSPAKGGGPAAPSGAARVPARPPTCVAPGPPWCVAFLASLCALACWAGGAGAHPGVSLRQPLLCLSVGRWVRRAAKWDACAGQPHPSWITSIYKDALFTRLLPACLALRRRCAPTPPGPTWPTRRRRAPSRRCACCWPKTMLLT